MNRDHIHEIVRSAGESIDASAPPTREQLRNRAVGDTPRGRWSTNLSVVAVAATTAAILVASLAFLTPGSDTSGPDAAATTVTPSATVTDSDEDYRPPTRDAIQKYLDETPGIPLVLFESLPDSYTWRGPSSIARDGRGTTMRASVFAPTPFDAGTVLIVCAQKREGQCPRGLYSVKREVDGVDVRVIATGSEPDDQIRYFMKNVSLDTSLSVGWLTN